jgi:hypothetical protein
MTKQTFIKKLMPLLMLILVGCGPTNNTTTEISEAKMRGWGIRSFNGHEYVIKGGSTFSGISHNPDCPCGKIDEKHK